MGVSMPEGSKWRSFWSLPGSERKVLLQALIALPSTALALRFVGFSRWQATLARLAPVDEKMSSGVAGSSLERAQRIARMVQAASQYSPRRGNCLEQSLVLWWLLRREGMPSALRIGVRKLESEFEAHAWVELDSVVLNDTGDVHQHYVPFGRAISILPDKPE